MSAAGQLPFPLPLLAAAEESRDDAVPTASVLAGCLRQFQLKRRVDYYESMTDLLPSIFGTAFHLLMERHTEYDQREIVDMLPGGRVEYDKGGPRHRELQLQARINLGLAGYEDVPVGGKCDYLHEGVLVRDWKSKRYLAQGHTPSRENKAQVNVYNWLAAQNGYTPAPRWELVYVSQSWVATFAGDTEALGFTEGWIRKRLLRWAEAEARGELVAPLPQLFADTDRYGRLPAPCGYCPVRATCLAALEGTNE